MVYLDVENGEEGFGDIGSIATVDYFSGNYRVFSNHLCSKRGRANPKHGELSTNRPHNRATKSILNQSESLLSNQTIPDLPLSP